YQATDRAVSSVNKFGAVEIDGRQFFFFSPIVLRVLPFGLRAALGKNIFRSHQISRIEIYLVNPGQDLHIFIFRTKSDLNPLRAALLHVVQEPANEIGDEVRPKRPAGAEISEHPGHVRYAGEHHAAISDGVGEDERFPIDDETDIAKGAHVESSGSDNNIR